MNIRQVIEQMRNEDKQYILLGCSVRSVAWSYTPQLNAWLSNHITNLRLKGIMGRN